MAVHQSGLSRVISAKPDPKKIVFPPTYFGIAARIEVGEFKLKTSSSITHQHRYIVIQYLLKLHLLPEELDVLT